MGVSEWFPRLSVISTCTCSTTTRPHHCRGPCTSPFLLPFSLRLGPSTGPPSCSAHSFGIQGFQHCPSAISCLGPPRHTCGIVPPPGFSSLIDAVTSSQLVWGVRATIGTRQSLLSFTDCWQQTSSVWIDASVLSVCQHPSSMHAHVCTTLAAIQLDFCRVLGFPRLSQSIRTASRET